MKVETKKILTLAAHNKDNQLTNYFMKKTYTHFYGELNE